MDVSLIAYTASVVATLLAISSYSHWGVVEVHAYSIPPRLEEQGYTPRILTNQIVDAMRRIQLEVASLDETEVVVQGHVQPIVDVASYFGIFELLRASETMLGLDPNRVEFEVTQNGGMAHWRVRGDHAVRGFQVRQGDLPLDDPEALIDHLGLQVTSYVSPFEALAYHFIQDSAASEYDATISEASTLLLDCQRRRAWACTDAGIKNAYLLRGMAYLYSERFARAFDDFDSANKIGTQTALGLAFLGDAYAALGHEDAAQQQYAEARQVDSTIGERIYELARGYAQSGNHRLADRRYTTASDLGIGSEPFLLDWGDTLFALGWHEAALARYRQAEAIDPETDLYAERIDRSRKALEAATAPAADKPAEPVPADGQGGD